MIKEVLGVILVTVILCLISFGITQMLYLGICVCFGFDYVFMYGVGIWIILIMLKNAF